MNLWEGLFGRKSDISTTSSPPSASPSVNTSTAPTIPPEQAKLSWAQTKLFNILPLVLPDFKDQPKEKQIVVTKFLAQRPDIFAQVLATNVKGWKEFPVEKKRKIMSAIYSPEQMEALDKWPWFDPVFALSAPIGFGTKAIAQQAIKAGAKAALKEAGKTAVASGASLAAETGMTLVGEPLEEKHPILASILAPLVGAGIGVASEKGIGALARKLSKPKIKEVAKEVGEKTTEELAEEVIEEATPSPSGQPKLKTKPQVGKGGLTFNLEQITKEAEEVVSKVEPEIKSEIKISPEEAIKVFDEFPVNPYPAEKKIRFKNLKDVWNVYKEELLGKEIETPLGFKFIPKEEDFFKIISAGRKKGFIQGLSLKEAIEKLEKGELSHSQIKGFQPVRAENLRLLEDVLKEPDLILESNKKPNRFVFIKQFQTKKGKRGFIGVLLNLENKETELISFHPKKLPNIKNRILKGEYKIKWAPHEEVPIPSRGEPGLHEGAGESIGPQETSSTNTVNKITQKTPFVKFEGEGWIIVPSEKDKFRIAFEDSELGQLVKDALYNQLEEVKAGGPPRLYRIEGGQGPIEYTRTRSTFPSWFKNKGWNKKRVISVLEKALKGESLTEKQAEIVKEALSSKEVKDYVKTVLSWGGEEVKLYAGIPLNEALQKGFKALNQLTQVAGEKAAKKELYKVADVLGYGKELKGKDIKGIKTWTAKLYNLEDIVRRYGKDYPEVKEIEYAMKWIREPQANRWAHAVDESIMKPLGKLSNESKEKVFRALYKESLTGKPDLSIRKFTPQELNVYRRIRRFLEIVWKDVKNSYRDALAQYINAKPMSAEEKAILKRALIEANPELVPEELKLKHSAFYRHLVRYSEMHPVPFYMPQKRTGNFMIKIIDPETKEVLFAHDVETSAEAKKIAEAFKKGDFSTIKNWFKELGVPFDPNAIPKNCKVVAEEISRVPVEAGEEIPFSKTIAFLHAVAERAKNLPQEDVANFYMNMAEDLDNFLKSLGWSSHLIKRKNIPGFSLKVKDAEKRLRGYLYGYGLSKAKKQAMEHSYKAFYKLVHKKGYKPAASNYYLGEISYYTKKYADAIFFYKKSVSAFMAGN